MTEYQQLAEHRDAAIARIYSDAAQKVLDLEADFERLLALAKQLGVNVIWADGKITLVPPDPLHT